MQRPAGQLVIVISALSLARQLWRYGEPDLAERALTLPAEAAASIGSRIGEFVLSGDADRLWPDGPREYSRSQILAVTEWLEGSPRPSSRVRRLPENRLPPHLQATEDELWRANNDVNDAVNRRNWGAHTGSADRAG